MAKRKSNKNSRHSFRQLFIQLLEKEMSPQQMEDFDGEKISLYVGEDSLTPSHIMAVVMMQKAMKGDAKAFEFIRDTIGEKPKDKTEPVTTDIPKIQIKRRENEQRN